MILIKTFLKLIDPIGGKAYGIYILDILIELLAD